jgi:hypothetical protein
MERWRKSKTIWKACQAPNNALGSPILEHRVIWRVRSWKRRSVFRPKSLERRGVYRNQGREQQTVGQSGRWSVEMWCSIENHITVWLMEICWLKNGVTFIICFLNDCKLGSGGMHCQWLPIHRQWQG